MENDSLLGTTVPLWGRFELQLTGPTEGNPYMDTDWSIVFSHEEQDVTVSGYYAGNGVYTAKFMPGKQGKWTYETFSQCSALNGLQGDFTCIPAGDGVHGSVRVRDRTRFAYADGTPYHAFGTTAYGWIHQPEEVRMATLQTLRESPFNKIRMCLFPKNYAFNALEPELYPYEGSPEEGFDTSRFNPLFWQHAEQCIESLLALHIEADLILFHPYDKGRWGFFLSTLYQVT